MNNHIPDKNDFIMMALDFFNELFEPSFNSERGNIEIRTFKPASQNFYGSEMDAAEQAYHLLQRGIDVYFGVNPRTIPQFAQENGRGKGHERSK